MRISESVIRIMSRFKWFMTRTSCDLLYVMSEYLKQYERNLLTKLKKKKYNFEKVYMVQFLKLIFR